MNIFKHLRQRLASRFQFLQKKRDSKKQVQAIIEKYNLNDPAERQKIIDQFTLMQTNKRAFGRKTQEEIKDKIKFMIHYKLIQIVE